MKKYLLPFFLILAACHSKKPEIIYDEGYHLQRSIDSTLASEHGHFGISGQEAVKLIRAFRNSGNWDSVYLYSDGHLKIIQQPKTTTRFKIRDVKGGWFGTEGFSTDRTRYATNAFYPRIAVSDSGFFIFCDSIPSNGMGVCRPTVIPMQFKMGKYRIIMEEMKDSSEWVKLVSWEECPYNSKKN
jgi:hypothetical protein